MSHYFEDRCTVLTNALENLLEHFDPTLGSYQVEDINGNIVDVNETLADDIDEAFKILREEDELLEEEETPNQTE